MPVGHLQVTVPGIISSRRARRQGRAVESPSGACYNSTADFRVPRRPSHLATMRIDTMQANLTSWASFHQRPGSVHVLAIRLMAVVLLALVIGPAFAAGPTAASQGDGNGEVAIAGELRQWHKVTLTLDGPWARESDDGPNPFTDCRLTVTFRHESGSPQYVVPGYFAADGDAADHSADSGMKWRAHLSPDKTGRWSYHGSFVQGKQAAVDPSMAGKALAAYDGKTGSFEIAATDKTDRDFRGQGRPDAETQRSDGARDGSQLARHHRADSVSTVSVYPRVSLKGTQP